MGILAPLQISRSAVQFGSKRSFPQQFVQVERTGEHGELAVGRARPHFLRFVTIQLDSVVIGIAQVYGFADTVVGRALQRNFRSQNSA